MHKPQGFKRQERSEGFRRVGGGPSADAAHVLDSLYVSDIDADLLVSIERYNTIMSFVSKHASSRQQRSQMCQDLCALISQADSLTELDNLLLLLKGYYMTLRDSAQPTAHAEDLLKLLLR